MVVRSLSVGVSLALTCGLAAAGLAQDSPRTTTTVLLGGDVSDGYVRREWTVASGLPQGTVHTMAVDRWGFAWLATNGGLVRFDGRGFRTFDGDEIPALVSNRVQWLIAGDGESIVAAAQEGGLTRLVSGRVVGQQPPMLPAPVWSISRDASGRLFAMTNAGPYRLDTTNTWRRVVLPGRMSTVGRLVFGPDGTQFFTDTSGVLVVGPDGAWHRVDDLSAHAMIPDGGGMWVGGRRGLAWVSLDGRTRRPAPAPLDTTPVTALARRTDGSLWIGASSGVWRFCVTAACGRAGARPIPLDTATSHRRVITVIGFPAPDVVLAGSESQGFVTYTQRAVERPRDPMALAGLSVHHLATSRDGSLWSGASRCGGVRRSHGDTTQLFVQPALGLTSNCIRAIHGARDGTLYLGQVGGLNQVRPDGTVLRRYGAKDGLPPEDIGPLLEDRAGRIWFGTETGRVGYVTSRGTIAFDTALALPPTPIWKLAQDSTGTLWIGGVGMLRSRDVRGTVRTYGAAEGVPRGQVRVLDADADGTLWIGTYGGGFAALRGGRVTRIPASAGIRERSVSSMVRDRHGRFWLSGNAGITSLAAADLRAFVTGTATAVEASRIGPEEDVPEGNGGHPAATTLPDGRIAFATVGGVVLIDPDSLRPTPARLLVDEIRLADVVQALPRRTVSGITGDPLLVRFASPRFGRGSSAQHRVRLSTGGDAWTVLPPDLTLHYAGLSAGTHRLLVKRASAAGAGSGDDEILTIVIVPRWYETTMARLLALLLATSALVAFQLARQRAVRRQFSDEIRDLEARRHADEERERYQSELAHVSRRATAGELATSLAHEVGQPLTAMVGNAEAGRRLLAHAPPDLTLIDTVLSDIVREGRRAANVIRELRSFLRRGQSSQTPLDLSATAEECLVLIRSEYHDAGVRLTTNLARGLPPVLGEPVLLQQVVLNLLTNAADALRALPSGGRHVHLRTRASHTGIRLTVSDSGEGVPADMRRRIFEAFHTTKPDGMGVGLAICRTIIDAHRGKLQVRESPMGGAVFSFVLPYAVSAE